MNNDIKSWIAQSLSSIFAVLIPIIQLFLPYIDKLPPEIQGIYVDSTHFFAVSIITAILSYIFIIAYKTNPYFTLTLPFQQGRQAARDAYRERLQLLYSIATTNSEENATPTESLTKIIKEVNETEPKKVYEISSSKFVSRGVTLLVFSSSVFLAIGISHATGSIASFLQAISYITSIIMAVLILTIYRDKVILNKEWKENEKNKNKKAMQLAIDHNSIDDYPKPEVKFISSFFGEGFPGDLHTWVQFDTKKYEIITDSNAEKLIKVTEINI